MRRRNKQETVSGSQPTRLVANMPDLILDHRWRRWIEISSLLVLATLVYHSTHWRFFHSFDWTWIQALESKPALFHWQQFLEGSPMEYRPVTSLYLLILHRIFGDWSPGFYAVTLILHAANSLLVYGVAERLSLGPLTARSAALLFLVHPGPFRAIVGIVASATVLQVHLTLWAVLLLFRYFQDGRRLWITSSSLAAMGAMFCKESGATVPLLLVAMEVLFRRRFTLVRLKPYLALGVVSVLYLFFSLGPSHGWREHPETYGIGLHILENLPYSIGYLFTIPVTHVGSGFSWTKTMGVLTLFLVSFILGTRQKGLFLAIWLFLAALPTSLFVTLGGYDTTGRYTYSFLAPFTLASAGLFQRVLALLQNLGWSGSRTLLWTSVVLGFGLLSLKTQSLVQRPYETHAGPKLYHYVTLSLMDYTKATPFLLAEMAGSSPAQVGEAASWGQRLAGSQRHPELQVVGLLVAGVAQAILDRPEESAQWFRRALDLREELQPVELMKGAEITGESIQELSRMWANSPPLTIR